jgi:hypothetical protein
MATAPQLTVPLAASLNAPVDPQSFVIVAKSDMQATQKDLEMAIQEVDTIRSNLNRYVYEAWALYALKPDSDGEVKFIHLLDKETKEEIAEFVDENGCPWLNYLMLPVLKHHTGTMYTRSKDSVVEYSFTKYEEESKPYSWSPYVLLAKTSRDGERTNPDRTYLKWLPIYEISNRTAYTDMAKPSFWKDAILDPDTDITISWTKVKDTSFVIPEICVHTLPPQEDDSIQHLKEEVEALKRENAALKLAIEARVGARATTPSGEAPIMWIPHDAV